jgi:hypothetical protein
MVMGGTSAIQLADRLGGRDGGELALALILTGLAVLAIALFFLERHRRRRRDARAVADEWRARVMMEELCPHGWQAQITLYGAGAPVPADAPPARVPQVSLDWTEFRQEGEGMERVAVERRVWAPSIPDALQAMVQDRRTDMTLEEIERRLEGDGAADAGD